jgi:hypothetical protein
MVDPATVVKLTVGKAIAAATTVAPAPAPATSAP